jgi:hypothetical protein
MDGCKDIPIFCLPSCFKALFCGQYEDIDEGANSDVKGGGEPPTADSVVEAAIEAQAQVKVNKDNTRLASYGTLLSQSISESKHKNALRQQVAPPA